MRVFFRFPRINFFKRFRYLCLTRDQSLQFQIFSIFSFFDFFFLNRNSIKRYHFTWKLNDFFLFLNVGVKFQFFFFFRPTFWSLFHLTSRDYSNLVFSPWKSKEIRRKKLISINIEKIIFDRIDFLIFIPDFCAIL